MSDTMHIVLSSDDNYARPLAVTIMSVLCSKAKDDSLSFHILDGGITADNRRRLSDMVTARNAAIEFIPISAELFSGKTLNITSQNHVSLATYYRLLIPALIAADRCIYMDCDMICRTSLAPLWSTPLGSDLAAAVKDIDENKQGDRLGLKRYFNAGLFLMDLEAMRREHTQEAFFRFLEEHHDRIVMHDQDVLNCVLEGRIHELDMAWNCQVAKTHKCRETGFHALSSTANILHFIGHRKPWHWKCKSPGRAEFWKYAEKAMWDITFSEKAHCAIIKNFSKILDFFYQESQMKSFTSQKNILEESFFLFNRKIISLGRKSHKYVKIANMTLWSMKKQQDKTTYSICGLKFKIKNSTSDIERRVKKIEHICTFSTLPSEAKPAVGYNRLIQQASVIILRDVVRVCKEAGIDCWLSYGTVLGAYRHGGIIPWDDDIDMAMLRKDYDKFVELYNQYGDKKFKAIYYTHENGRYNFVKVVSHLNNVFVDIFPQDIDGRNLPLEERVRDVDNNKSLLLNDDFWKKNKTDLRNQTDIKAYHQHLISIYKNKPDQNFHDEAIIFMGAECNIDNPCVCNTVASIFPLQEVEFEGCVCQAPGDMELYLYQMFGDFMNYPPSIEMHHDSNNVSKKDMIECLKFVREFW